MTKRDIEITDAFGERPIDDLLGEALRRHRLGAIRPLWRDMPEGDQKHAWRRLGARLLADVSSLPAFDPREASS